MGAITPVEFVTLHGCSEECGENACGFLASNNLWSLACRDRSTKVSAAGSFADVSYTKANTPTVRKQLTSA